MKKLLSVALFFSILTSSVPLSISASDLKSYNDLSQIEISDAYTNIAGEHIILYKKTNNPTILLDSSGEFHIVHNNYKDTEIRVTSGSELPIEELLEAASSEVEKSPDMYVPTITKSSDTAYIMKASRSDYRNALNKLLISQSCVERITDEYETAEDTANVYSTELLFVSADMSPTEIEEKYSALGLIYEESKTEDANNAGFDYAFKFNESGISDRSQIYSELKAMLSDGCNFTVIGAMTEMAYKPEKTYNSYEVIYDKTSGILRGDANLDGNVNIADAVLVMQVATNPDKYAQGKSELSIKPQGEINADVDGKKGLSNSDALLIQKFKLGLIDKF